MARKCLISIVEIILAIHLLILGGILRPADRQRIPFKTIVRGADRRFQIEIREIISSIFGEIGMILSCVCNNSDNTFAVEQSRLRHVITLRVDP
jgi:hypothetical protein